MNTLCSDFKHVDDYAAGTGQTPETAETAPETPYFSAGRALRCMEIAHTINKCHNACDPPPTQARRGEFVGSIHSGNRVA